MKSVGLLHTFWDIEVGRTVSSSECIIATGILAVARLKVNPRNYNISPAILVDAKNNLLEDCFKCQGDRLEDVYKDFPKEWYPMKVLGRGELEMKMLIISFLLSRSQSNMLHF